MAMSTLPGSAEKAAASARALARAYYILVRHPSSGVMRLRELPEQDRPSAEACLSIAIFVIYVLGVAAPGGMGQAMAQTVLGTASVRGLAVAAFVTVFLSLVYAGFWRIVTRGSTRGKQYVGDSLLLATQTLQFVAPFLLLIRGGVLPYYLLPFSIKEVVHPVVTNLLSIVPAGALIILSLLGAISYADKCEAELRSYP